LDGLISHPSAKGISFDYIKGCEILGTDKSNFEEAVKKAQGADVIILAIGENKDLSGEAASRAIIRIPGVQEDLLRELKATGKPIATVVMNGRPLVLNDVDENSNAVLEAWWLGTQAGNALADIILGAYNPSGKLAISFPRHEGQIPVFYAAKNTGRPPIEGIKWNSKYLDMPNTPLYPFGYGLSYTSFRYGKPSVDKLTFGKNDNITVSVNVTNTGNYDGEEVIQLYVRDMVASVTRPVKELKGFQKIFLKKGETKEVRFTLSKEAFSFFNQQMIYDTEPGEFEIFVGGDSNTDNKIRVTMN
jgi:beta-glucosidase